MLRVVIHRWPASAGDLSRLTDLLRSVDVFTPSFLADGVDLYDPAVYLREAEQHGTQTVLRLDRNVVTRWAGLVRGDVPAPDHRLAAALLAFAQCAGIDIEPNIALYELAAHDGAAAAAQELAALRVAEHLHPAVWTDLALGRADRVPARALRRLAGAPPHAERDRAVDFTMPLRRWRRNYVLCLKIAALELAGGTAADRVLEFVRWMYTDFQLGGPALFLAAQYLAPNASRKRLLKGLRSPDRERALAGVRNAAWDVTLVSLFLDDVASQAGEGRLTLLTSLDAGVHRLARSVTDARAWADDPAARCRAVLHELWGPDQGERIAAAVLASYAALDAPTRQMNQSSAPGFVDWHIAHGEAAVRAWAPSRA